MRAFGKLLAHDGACNKRDAIHGGSNIAQGVEQAICGCQVFRLAHNSGAVVLQKGKEVGLVKGDLHARDTFQLVERAARVAESASTHHGHVNLRVHSGKQGGHNERRFVAYAARGVLVYGCSRQAREVNLRTRLHHMEGELAGLLVIHAAQKDGHKERRGLVVRNRARRVARYEKANLLVGERAAIALFLDDVVHAHGSLPRQILRTKAIGEYLLERALDRLLALNAAQNDGEGCRVAPLHHHLTAHTAGRANALRGAAFWATHNSNGAKIAMPIKNGAEKRRALGTGAGGVSCVFEVSASIDRAICAKECCSYSKV